MDFFSFSDQGPRAENQDFYCIENFDSEWLLAVADGVGGNKGGKIASNSTLGVLSNCYSKGVGLTHCFDIAHQELLEMAKESIDLRGMATTLTAIVCDGLSLTGVHCGDTRAYILRGKGLKQLTKDHTEVQRLLDEGRMTKLQAIDYPRKNILTSALGTNRELIKQEFSFELCVGDRIIIMSDGVHSLLTKRQIQIESSKEANFTIFCKNLIQQVLAIGAEDNFTLIGVQIT